MKEINVTGQKRTDLGKKASKTLRKEGLIPCNLYGEKKGENGAPEAMSFAVPFAELRKIIYTPHVYVINLIIDGESHTAIMKEIQFHPTTDAPLHVDFYEVNDQKPITIGIPVKLTGLAQGVRDGGRMNLSIRKINVQRSVCCWVELDLLHDSCVALTVDDEVDHVYMRSVDDFTQLSEWNCE